MTLRIFASFSDVGCSSHPARGQLSLPFSPVGLLFTVVSRCRGPLVPPLSWRRQAASTDTFQIYTVCAHPPTTKTLFAFLTNQQIRSNKSTSFNTLLFAHLSILRQSATSVRARRTIRPRGETVAACKNCLANRADQSSRCVHRWFFNLRMRSPAL